MAPQLTGMKAPSRRGEPVAQRCSPPWPIGRCDSPTAGSRARRATVSGSRLASSRGEAMLPLDRKLLRDLRQLKGQALAIGLVVAAGVAMFIMYFSTFESLDRTHRTYYDRYRFADVFASLKRAPLAAVAKIEALPGVARVEPRVVTRVTLDVAGMTEPAVGLLLSIPEHRRATLNDLCLVEGR